jgi:hypothetical protein
MNEAPAATAEDIRVECKDLDGKKMCKPIKVGDPVDEGFKLMNDIIFNSFFIF